jgi:hypothetical protein
MKIGASMPSPVTRLPWWCLPLLAANIVVAIIAWIVVGLFMR